MLYTTSSGRWGPGTGERHLASPGGVPFGMIPAMLFSLTYSLASCLAELLLILHHSDAQFRAEVLTLPHQLRVLERRSPALAAD